MPIHNQTLDDTDSALINIEIGIPTILASKLSGDRKVIPSPVAGVALIDTGASLSAIDEELAQSLDLSPIGECSLLTASQTDGTALLYLVRISLPDIGGSAILDGQLPVAGCKLRAQGLDALLGRDVLKDMILIFNGRSGMFTLAY